ncbi:MAG: hypothetical protein QME69_02650 [Candidatus Saccharicenans sp.]|nr:hypothetical protein [Candidatus Saccharicenans sp.]
MLAEYIEKKGFLIADFLTALRGLIALRLAFILWQGKSALDAFLVLIFAAWLSDCLDGYFARKSFRPGNLAEADG